MGLCHRFTSDEPVHRGNVLSCLHSWTEGQQGYICPSTSPDSSSFFFVTEEDGGLRPRIFYQALNKIVHLPSNFHLISWIHQPQTNPYKWEEGGCHHHLANTHNHQRTPKIPNLPQLLPMFHQRLQFCFFTTCQPSEIQAQDNDWSPESLHICTPPDPSQPRQTLRCQSWRVLRSGCSALSAARDCSSTIYYDIRNTELFAIKLYLEEWRHWLKGAHQFEFTDCVRPLMFCSPRLCWLKSIWALNFSCFY